MDDTDGRFEAMESRLIKTIQEDLAVQTRFLIAVTIAGMVVVALLGLAAS